jgi:hypothetical protein
LQKESELKVRLRSLIDKEKVILSRQGRPGTSSSINSLKEAFRQFEQDLNKLQVRKKDNNKIVGQFYRGDDSLYFYKVPDSQKGYTLDPLISLSVGWATNTNKKARTNAYKHSLSGLEIRRDKRHWIPKDLEKVGQAFKIQH